MIVRRTKTAKPEYVPSGAFPDRAPSTARGNRRHKARNEETRAKLEKRWATLKR